MKQIEDTGNQIRQDVRTARSVDVRTRLIPQQNFIINHSINENVFKKY
jgi:hypothetical protein